MPELRPYRPGDERGICDLFSACHGRPLPPDLWSWRYSARSGRPAVIDVAEDAGRIVAHLGALPVTLRREAATLSAGLWVDLMVHPDYRNLSLFLDMAEANHRRCAEAGVRLVFAFPNDRSYPVLKRMLGWNSIEELDALEASLNDLKPGDGGPATTPLTAFGADHAELRRRLTPSGVLASDKTVESLTWRYRRRPGRDYALREARGARGELRGWIAVHVFDGPQGRIGDILDFWAEPDAFEPLWAWALAHFRAGDAGTVSAWALKESPLFALYSARGLAPRGPRAHFAGRWTSPADAEPFPGRGRDWLVSKGDSDVF